MTRRGLPVGPPPPLQDLVDLPLDQPTAESPFLRSRRRSRVRPRRRGMSAALVLGLQVLAVGLIAVLGAWTAWQRVFASERLRVGRIEVRGSHFLSEGEVRELMGPAVGENILGLDIEALKTRLRSSPWVAEATVTRRLPDTLSVEIHERVPLALAELDRLYLMDSEGGLIDIYGPRTGAFDLPIVRGLLGVEEASRRERARRAGALLADLGDLAGEVSEVYVQPSGDLRVVLRGAGEVLLFGDPPYRERLLTFLSLRKDLAEKAPDAEQFDLRYRGRIYARRPSLAAAAAARAAAQAGEGTAAAAPVAQPRQAPPAAAGPGRPVTSATRSEEPVAGPGATQPRSEPRAARVVDGAAPGGGFTPPQRAGGLGSATPSRHEVRAAPGGGFTPPQGAGGLGGAPPSRHEIGAARVGGFTPPQRAGGLGGVTQHPPEQD